MFKTFKITIVLYVFAAANVMHASLQIAIPVRDFCAGNSLVLIARDGNGLEKVEGYVSLDNGKTKFSHDEILNHPTLLSLDQQESAVVAVLKQDQALLDDDSIIYLYFEVDPSRIVRVLMIKNSLFADNPFDVVEFSAAVYGDDDDEDDCFDFSNDDLSHLNLTDLENMQVGSLSAYDKMVLAFYTLWAIQSTQVKQSYKHFRSWINSHYAE